MWETGKHVLGSRGGLPPLFGNPLAGLGTLLVSPGKSVFLYSPPAVLAIIGMRYLRRNSPPIAFAAIGAAFILVGFISCIAFAGGDWCWGPRYLVPLLPLWALAFPFLFRAGVIRRDVILAIVGLGLVVQVLAISAENQKFFFERGLKDLFWAEDPWFYFKHSALLARINETLALNEPLPSTASVFNSIPVPQWTTYCILGPPPNVPRSLAPAWMRNYQIYYLPRPWPLWMARLRPAMRPINMTAWIGSLVTMLFVGSGLICSGLRKAGKPAAYSDSEINNAQVCHE